MPLTLLKGEYHILKNRPDGDSIKFFPNDPELWQRVGRVRTNRSGGAQLRLDAIDALETHYRPRVAGGSEQRQPREFGDKATDALLKFVGFSSFTRGGDETIQNATPATVPGYILSSGSDKYGRAIAFIFTGDIKAKDGSSIFLDREKLKSSANYHLLESGLVYPTFYSKLFFDLREELTQAAQQARSAGKGLWPLDRTNSGFEVKSLSTITDEVVILPKLFRRLLDYLELNNGDPGLEGFIANLKAKADEVTVLPTGQFTHFDTVVKVENQKLSLTVPPENLIFREG
jgi:endonuclease YncB( thermonuclease family)